MSNPRITVTFTEPQMEFIKEAAKRTGNTSSEIVRKAVENFATHGAIHDYIAQLRDKNTD